MNHSFDALIEDRRAVSAYIHESSYVDSPCHIGEHTSILHFSHIMANTIIGNHCQIGRNVTIASGVLLGDYVRVFNNAQLNSGVILENYVSCGPGVIFIENRYIRANPKNLSRISPTLVRRGAQIGANTTMASGFSIGRFAFVEAGTIVDRNVPDFAIVYGNPLRFAGWRCECGQSLVLDHQMSSRTNAEMLPATGASPTELSEMSCAYCHRRYLRQSKWKILQLTQGDLTLDTHPQFNSTIRTAESPD